MFNILRAFTDCNPHRVASDADSNYPSTDDSYPLGVNWHNVDDNGNITSGSIEFAVGEHPNAAQQSWLDNHEHIGPYTIVEED